MIKEPTSTKVFVHIGKDTEGNITEFDQTENDRIMALSKHKRMKERRPELSWSMSQRIVTGCNIQDEVNLIDSP